MQRLKTALAVGTIIASYGLVMGTADAQDKKYRFVIRRSPT